MREDMDKILKVGHKRQKWSDRFNIGRYKDRMAKEDAPNWEKTSKSWKHDPRYSHTSMKPLLRFLRKSVGRRWNDVYSEIKQIINGDQESIRWMMEQLKGEYAKVRTDIKDVRKYKGKEYPIDNRGFWIYEDFWVHPDSGILMAPIPRVYTKSKKSPPKYIHIEGRHYRMLFPDGENGCWFEITFSPFPENDVYAHKFDVAEMDSVDRIRAYRYDGELYYASAKRQLNKKEIKQLGLKDKFAGVRPGDEKQQDPWGHRRF